jgi:hypothetical protein
MKRFCLFVILLFIVSHSYAQIGFGPEVGANISNYYGRLNGATNVTRLSGGIRAGLLFDLRIKGNIFLQPGLLYAKNAKIPPPLTGSYVTSLKINTLEFPVHLVYKVNGPANSRPYFALGPYFGYNVSGTVEQKESHPLKTGSGANDDIKAIDMGISTSLGLQLSNGLYTCLLYRIGLVNLLPKGNADNSVKNLNFGICLGYFFKEHYPLKPAGKAK